MLRKLALSASLLALAGSLAVVQAETMKNPPSGRSVAAPSSLFDDALASLRYL
jgi:hypothetical protein